MWYNFLEQTTFINNIYTRIPELVNVRIEKVEISNEGNRISMSFDMPYFPDKPPIKWCNANYNTANVNIDLFEIHEVNISSNQNAYFGSIDILQHEYGLELCIQGTVNVRIIAESGLIQSVVGYFNQPVNWGREC